MERIREFTGVAMLPLAVAVALTSFAGNSLLCRLALRPRSPAPPSTAFATPPATDPATNPATNAATNPATTASGQQAIDPGTFTVVRIGAGALMLLAVAVLRRPKSPWTVVGGSWPAALALFVYAVAFSFAYTRLPTGTGALLLFGSVQLAMLIGSRWRGERFRGADVLALGLAGSGVAVLLAPGVSAPPPGAATLMVLSGIAWGVYSLLGRRLGGDPIAATTGNFLRAAAPAAALAWLIVVLPNAWWSSSVEPASAANRVGYAEPRGWLLAIVSGALTSGLGYVVWYAALRNLAAKTAALLQLAVPWIATAGGVALLHERPTSAMFIAGPLIAAGVWFAVRPTPATSTPATSTPATSTPATPTSLSTSSHPDSAPAATPPAPDRSDRR
jgi:drug/metabolite transporter (DMT)-like permease